ncbi:hypothetical protein HGRIS_014513 [Hohenbuehelia grisea]|uniref:Uncharacterized protein n=1 Tax=Hohenbuehelia grisea TaxID=104357 RepID=A0ABR3JTN9_9AGAR
MTTCLDLNPRTPLIRNAITSFTLHCIRRRLPLQCSPWIPPKRTNGHDTQSTQRAQPPSVTVPESLTQPSPDTSNLQLICTLILACRARRTPKTGKRERGPAMGIGMAARGRMGAAQMVPFFVLFGPCES